MIKKFFGAVFCSVFLALAAFAQNGEEPIVWKLSAENKPLAANLAFDAKLTATLSANWHLYSISQPPGGPNATVISVKEEKGFKLREAIRAAPPTKSYDNNFRMETEFYSKSAEFVLPVEATAAGKNTNDLSVSVTFQLCNDEVCLPPDTVEVKANAETSAPSLPPVAETTSPVKSATQDSTKSEAIDFAFVDFNGKARNLSEFRGKYVLLDFWATWCRPCLADIPKLKELYDKHKASGFEIIGMDSETIGDESETPDPEFAKETAERARMIVKTRGVTWTQATAETAVPVANKVFQVKALPTKILLDKEGRIIARIGEKDNLSGIVEKLLAENK